MAKKIFLFLLIIIINVKMHSFSPSIDKLIINGTKKLLNMHIKSAKKSFKKLRILKPKHPVGYFYMGFTYLITGLNTYFSKKRLRIFEDYVNQGYYFGNKIQNPSPDDKFYMVAIRSMKAFIEFKKNRYAQAIAEGLKAFSDLDKLTKRYPNYIDAKLGLGLYHMLLTLIPGSVRKILFLVNFKASHKKVINYLKLVSRKGKFFNDAALALLAFYKTFYLKKHSIARKDYLILMKKYPRNFFFYINYIYSFYYQKKYLICLKLIQKYKKYFTDILGNKKSLWLFRFNFLEGRIRFNLKQLDTALKLFQNVIKERIKNWTKDYYCVYSILYRGMIYDATNKRDKALRSYFLLKKNLDTSLIRAKNFAQRFIKKQYVWKDPKKKKNKKPKRGFTLN